MVLSWHAPAHARSRRAGGRFDSGTIVGLGVLAACALAAFVVRELLAREPILDLSIFGDRNFALGSVVMAGAGLGFYASMLLLALVTQKQMGYDAWTSGLVLAPAGLGQAVVLLAVGRLVSTTTSGCSSPSASSERHRDVPDVQRHAQRRLLGPRGAVHPGIGMGFIFVPLQTLALGTIPPLQMGHARRRSTWSGIGGGIGVASPPRCCPGGATTRPCWRARGRVERRPRSASRLGRALGRTVRLVHRAAAGAGRSIATRWAGAGSRTPTTSA
jgi:hypothetical protein